MGLVFLAANRDPAPEEVESSEPFAHVNYGGVYFFLYPGVQRLRELTGELIDPQKNAYFRGSTLTELEEFLALSTESAMREAPEWNQRVGTMQSGEVWHQLTLRGDVLELLRRLGDATRAARETGMGVLFWGE